MTASRLRGFTLIELLVVIAIIAILAAILFPVFANARARARTTRCQAHQKELYLALMMYTDDYNRLPSYQFLTWKGNTRLYEPYVKNDDIMVCPPDQAYAYNESLISPLSNETYASWCGVAQVQVRVPDCFARSGSFPPATGRSMSSIPLPSATPVFFDSFQHSKRPDGKMTGYGWGADDAVNSKRSLNDHHGGANYAFMDGHVRWHGPHNKVILTPVEGLDYDGDGIVGDNIIMR